MAYESTQQRGLHEEKSSRGVCPFLINRSNVMFAAVQLLCCGCRVTAVVLPCCCYTDAVKLLGCYCAAGVLCHAVMLRCAADDVQLKLCC